MLPDKIQEEDFFRLSVAIDGGQQIDADGNRVNVNLYDDGKVNVNSNHPGNSNDNLRCSVCRTLISF